MGSGNCDALLAAQFSSAELLRLLSREHPAQAASEIELFHVKDEPRIVRVRGASGQETPEIPALGLVRSHRCDGCSQHYGRLASLATKQ